MNRYTYFIYWVFILLFFISTNMMAQDNSLISEVYGSSDYHAQQHYHCLSDSHRSAIIAQNRNTVRRLRLDPSLMAGSRLGSLGWPLEQVIGYNDPSYYLITNFVDQDKRANVLLDYNCGKRTYDGHTGTDIAIWPFGWHKKNIGQVNVIAAQSGVIIGKDDGNFDDNCEWKNQGWNAVYLLHNDGTEGWYGHLKKNSLTSKSIGERVNKGEYLGKVGSSGISTGPHLHFELYSNEATPRLLDPFGGNCNSLNKELWENPKPYLDPAILLLGTHDCAPFQPDGCPAQNFDLCEKEIFKPNDLIKFSVNFRQQTSSITTYFNVYNPQNLQLFSWAQSPRDFDYGSWWYREYRISSDAVPGIYRYTATFKGETFEKEFVVQSSSNVSEVESTPQVIIIQNPVIDELQLLGVENISSYQIYHINGKEMSHNVGFEGNRIGVASLSTGVYILKIKLRGGQIQTLKFVKFE